MTNKIYNVYRSILLNEKYINNGLPPNEFEEHYVLKTLPCFLGIGYICDLDAWSIHPHSHEHFEMSYVSKGKCLIEINGTEYTASAGDIVLYNAGSQHFEKKHPDTPVELFVFAADNIHYKNYPINTLTPPREFTHYTHRSARQQI